VLASGRPYAQRWTFYIDKEGIIRAIDKSVKAGNHGSDVAAKLAELGFPEK
jgi:peroxiredoxin Q/BCP